MPSPKNYIAPSYHRDQTSPLNESTNFEEESANNSYDQFNNDILQIFEMYCSLSDPINTQFLSLSKFIKMMATVKEMCDEDDQFNLPNADIELIFAKASNYGNDKNRKTRDVLNFSQFLFALELIAMKVYSYSPSGIGQLIRDYILPLKEHIQNEVERSSEHILHLMEILKDEEMVNLLELIHQTLYPYFTFYSNEEGLMTSDFFVEFCHDFRIFPDILPEEIVMNFFLTLSNFYSTDEHKEPNNENTWENGVIDEHLFVEVLALSALEMRFQDPQPTQIEKVIVLIDWMNNSNGAKKMYEANGGDPNDQIDLLAIIKQAYPHLFQDDK